MTTTATNENATTSTDITALIHSASDGLSNKNPFISASLFSLFDSMSALDLMDPKMDGCEIPISYYKNQGLKSALDHQSSSRSGDDVERERTVPPRPVPQSLHDDISPLPWEGLTMRQARFIIMEIISRFQAYMDGHSVAETIYTCLYAQNTILLDMQKILESRGSGMESSNEGGTETETESMSAQLAVWIASLFMVKTSKLVRNIVQLADIYEEEDFTMSASKFDFHPLFEDQDLGKVETLIFEKLAKFNENGDDDDADRKMERSFVVSLLDFMSSFYNTCSTLMNLSKENVVQNAGFITEEISTQVQKLKEAIETMKGSGSDGLLLEATENDKKLIFQAFDPYINRKTLGNSPVRKVPFLPPMEALTSLMKTYDEIRSGSCNLLLKGNTVSRIHRMLSTMSTKSFNILSRSLVVTNLYFENQLLGRYSLAFSIAKHMHRWGVPETLTGTDYGVKFINRLCKPIYDTFKLLVLNRGRQRGYMDVLLFKDWAALQQDAALVDAAFCDEFNLSNGAAPTLYVTNYVLSTVVGLMDHHVGLGVELGLFNGHYHLTTAYWYRDYLLSTRLNIGSSMKEHLKQKKAMEAQIAMEEAQAAAKLAAKVKSDKGGGKKKGKGKKRGKCGGNAAAKIAAATAAEAAKPRITVEDEEDTLELLLMNVQRALCRGTVMFLTALNQTKVLERPNYKFISNELNFSKRFESFKLIRRPEPLAFADFSKGTDFTAVAPETLLSSASEMYKTARSLLENINGKSAQKQIKDDYSSISNEDATKLIKVCIGNSLFLHKLSQIQTGTTEKSLDSHDVKFNFSSSTQFCTINIS
uniref:Uncharacterized protein n=1 Tax=Chaetoceros debilis TaxID=122233 RepID=A0A7S3QCU7_9STRA